MSAAILVENLSKKFRRYRPDRPASLKEAMLHGLRGLGTKECFWALRHINLSIQQGHAVGLIGTNGAGKSTLLRLIGGVGRPDSGRVKLQGRVGALLDLTAGFAPDLTGRENTFITGVICGLTRRQVAARMDQIVSFAQLEQFIDNPIRTYSTGMQMRLGFSIAAHTDPEVLLIDEVLAVGDLAFQQKCMQRIEQFKKNGCTIVMISHDPGQIKQLCDRVVWLRAGQVAADGLPEIVVGDYVAELASETRRRTPSLQQTIRTAFGTELQPQKNRFGSMEIEICGLRLLDQEGLPVEEFSSGQSLQIVISYRTTNLIPQPVFSLSISRQDGFVLLDTNTAAQGLPMPDLQGCGEVVLSLERLDLAGGEYFVDVGIFERDWTYGYDYHWHVYPLRVHPTAPTKGLLQPPQAWRLQPLTPEPPVPKSMTNSGE